jgi:alkylmercury lyase
MQTAVQLDMFLPTLERLATRCSSAGPLLPGFSLLARGRPVSVEEIARAADVDAAEVELAVDAARCERDAQGRLIDLYGLTLTPTLHRLTIDGKVLFSCCALWAHVIPKLVDRTVEVESVDPMRHELVRLIISPAVIDAVEPPGAVATLAVADQDAIDRDVCEAWCCQVAHFVSRESAEEFAAGRSTCHVVELPELRQATERFHQAIWSAIKT